MSLVEGGSTVNREEHALGRDAVEGHLVAEGVGYVLAIEEEEGVWLGIGVGTDVLARNLHQL